MADGQNNRSFSIHIHQYYYTSSTTAFRVHQEDDMSAVAWKDFVFGVVVVMMLLVSCQAFLPSRGGLSVRCSRRSQQSFHRQRSLARASTPNRRNFDDMPYRDDFDEYNGDMMGDVGPPQYQDQANDDFPPSFQESGSLDVQRRRRPRQDGAMDFQYDDEENDEYYDGEDMFYDDDEEEEPSPGNYWTNPDRGISRSSPTPTRSGPSLRERRPRRDFSSPQRSGQRRYVV